MASENRINIVHGKTATALTATDSKMFVNLTRFQWDLKPRVSIICTEECKTKSNLSLSILSLLLSFHEEYVWIK